MSTSVSKEYLMREYIEKDRSMQSIAEELGISRSGLWYILKKYGLIGTTKKKHIVRGISDSIITDDNENIAYLAGLVACDGFVAYGNKVRIALSGEPGKQIIYDLADKLGYANKISKLTKHGGFSENPYYELAITSDKLIEHFRHRYNLYGRKSDGLDRFPYNLMEYPEHIQVAYMLGIFDGDSSIDKSRGRFQICMGNESFLGMITDFLNEKFNANIIIRYRYDREVNYPYIVIPREISERIAIWLYSTDCVHINYKKNRVISAFSE